MAHRGYVAQTNEDGSIQYEYQRWSSWDLHENVAPFRGPLSQSEEDDKIPEKYPDEGESKNAGSLEDFVVNIVSEKGGNIEAVWIDGVCYICWAPVLIECRKKSDWANRVNDFWDENKNGIDDKALEETDRKVIDYR